MLKIENLKVSLKETKQQIISNFNLEIKEKEVHFLLGKNGSGKSTLAMTLAGSEKYEITNGIITLNNKIINEMKPYERVSSGLFLSYQMPVSIAGLTFSTLLKHSVNSIRRAKNLTPYNAIQFFQKIEEYSKLLEIPNEWLSREVNVGFSGGEKKKMEMLQMLMAEPNISILDEPDSGVDVDAVNIISKAIDYCIEKLNTSFLIITHYEKLFEKIPVSSVHIFNKGEIIKSGNIELAKEITKNGFEKFLK